VVKKKKADQVAKAALAAAKPRKPAKGRSRNPPPPLAPSVDPRPTAQAVYEIPEPRFLLAFGVLSMMLLTVAVTPRFLLARAPGDLANRRGGLGFAALAIAFVPLLIVIGRALTQ
jgi:hypothetical protein